MTLRPCTPTSLQSCYFFTFKRDAQFVTPLTSVAAQKMQRYHLEVKGIPEYIKMLKDAQKQAGRASQTIANETLVLFVSTAMLTKEIFPRKNDDWEDRAEANKT